MTQIIFKDRDVVFANNPKSIFVNATITEIDADKLTIKGDHLETVYVPEGTPFLDFIPVMAEEVKTTVLAKISEWDKNPTVYNKPKLMKYIYIVERNIFTRLLVWIIQSLSFDIIKFNPSATRRAVLSEGYYTTGHKRPIESEITDAEYQTMSLLENAKVKVKNIIE